MVKRVVQIVHFISFDLTNVKVYVMSKTRKTLVITFLVLGSVLIFMSFFAKLGHWSNGLCCTFAFSGFLLAITSLILTILSSKAK